MPVFGIFPWTNRMGRFNIFVWLYFFVYFLASDGGSPLYLETLQYYTMILQRHRIIVGETRFETGTSAPEVWCAANEPPHVVLIADVI